LPVFAHRSVTGEGDWDWNKALAAGISGALIGAAVGSAIDTAGASLGVIGTLAASTASGAAFGAGVGAATGGKLFESGKTVDWSGYMAGGAKGAVVGAVSGLVGGGAGALASRGITALLGQGVTGTAASALGGGFVGGFVGDQAAQGFAIGVGWQKPEDYSLGRSLIAGGIGAGLSGIGAGYKAWRQPVASANAGSPVNETVGNRSPIGWLRDPFAGLRLRLLTRSVTGEVDAAIITLACKLLTNSEGKRAVFRPFVRKFCE